MLPQPLQTWGEMPPCATFARVRFTVKARDCFRRIVLKMNFDFSKKKIKKLQMLRHLPSDFSFNHKLCNALDTF